jgi:hypothetical protein
VYTNTLLRRGSAMRPRYRTCADSNQWHDTGCQTGSQVTSSKGAAGITGVSLPLGLASESQHRSSSRVASGGNPINDHGSQWVGERAENAFRRREKKALASAFITQLFVSSGIKRSGLWSRDSKMLHSTDALGVGPGQVGIHKADDEMRCRTIY